MSVFKKRIFYIYLLSVFLNLMYDLMYTSNVYLHIHMDGVEDRGQLVEAIYLLLPCRLYGCNSGQAY